MPQKSSSRNILLPWNINIDIGKLFTYFTSQVLASHYFHSISPNPLLYFNVSTGNDLFLFRFNCDVQLQTQTSAFYKGMTNKLVLKQIWNVGEWLVSPMQLYAQLLCLSLNLIYSCLLQIHLSYPTRVGIKQNDFLDGN